VGSAVAHIDSRRWCTGSEYTHVVCVTGSTGLGVHILAQRILIVHLPVIYCTIVLVPWYNENKM
jgi:hypothetical protein